MWTRMRCYGLLLFALGSGMVFAQFPLSQAIAVQDEDPRTANLRERLVNGLRVRTDEERAFIEKVIVGVENGSIPQDLVDSSFLWVRNKKSRSNFPFFYFERVLRIQGKKRGVAIPPFSYPNR